MANIGFTALRTLIANTFFNRTVGQTKLRGDIHRDVELDFVDTVEAGLNNKQDTLVSGTNIKTINGESVLGSGNLVVTGSGETAETIKEKYESNPDTNAFTDAEKANLANQSGTNTGDQDLSGYVAESDYNQARSLLVQQSGVGTPETLVISPSTILGRQTGAGSAIGALTASEVRTIIDVYSKAETDLLAKTKIHTKTATFNTSTVDEYEDKNVILCNSATNINAIFDRTGDYWEGQEFIFKQINSGKVIATNSGQADTTLRGYDGTTTIETTGINTSFGAKITSITRDVSNNITNLTVDFF